MKLKGHNRLAITLSRALCAVGRLAAYASLLFLALVTPAFSQPATSPITMPTTCVRNKGECPRGSARLSYAYLPQPPSGVDANGRPYNHRGFIAWVYDCASTSCTAGGGTTLCALRGSDDGLTWDVVVCGGTGSGGGAPSDAQYWTGAANGPLTAEKNLGALATAIVINTGGVPSAYAGSGCGAGQAIRHLTAVGAADICSALGVAGAEDGNSVGTGFLTVNCGFGLDCTPSGTQLTIAVDPTELGGTGGGGATAAGFNPFGSQGSSTIAAPTADQCIAWQAGSPYAGNNAFVVALEITSADANDIVKVGIYNKTGSARIYSGSFTVNTVARTTALNGDSFQAWTAADHWFVLCCDSPDGLCTTRFRSAGGAPIYGKQFTFTNPNNNAVLPTAINSFIPVDPWTVNAEPPALFVRLE
jgi:hypothetical protein